MVQMNKLIVAMLCMAGMCHASVSRGNNNDTYCVDQWGAKIQMVDSESVLQSTQIKFTTPTAMY